MALSRDIINAGFVMLLDRPCVGRKMDFYKASEMSEEEYLNHLATSAEHERKFQAYTSNKEFVTHIYNFAFSSSSTKDSSGIDYWVNDLDSGQSRGAVVRNMFYGAKEKNEDRLMKKIEFSQYIVERFASIPNGECGVHTFGFHHHIDVTDDNTLFIAKQLADKELKRLIICESPNCCS